MVHEYSGVSCQVSITRKSPLPDMSMNATDEVIVHQSKQST